MKTINLNRYQWFAIIITAITFLLLVFAKCCAPEPKPALTEKEELIQDTLTDWDLMWIAISIKESQINDSAKNPKSTASGRYQILKITVDEANRIAGYKKYTYDDRFKADKSIQMLNEIHDKHNPDKSIKRAIKLHSIGFANDSLSISKFEAYKKSIDEEIDKLKTQVKQLRIEIDSVNVDMLNIF